MDPYFQEQLAQPSPSTTLSAFLMDVDAKTTTWQNRAAKQQARGPPGQNRAPNPNSSAPQSSTHPPSQSRPAEPHHRGFQYKNRPRLLRGSKENGKQAYTYMVGVADDGTPQWIDEDPNADDDYTE